MKAKAGITFTFINLADAFIQSDLQLRLRLTYNSKGYGVCFIGDDTSTLPIRSALDMVRYDFTGCAINRGRLTSYYNLYGHRQADSTECPGNSLYHEIHNWALWEECIVVPVQTITVSLCVFLCFSLQSYLFVLMTVASTMNN